MRLSQRGGRALTSHRTAFWHRLGVRCVVLHVSFAPEAVAGAGLAFAVKRLVADQV